MRNIPPGTPETQGWEEYLSPRLRALRACESRIRDLQAHRPSRSAADGLARRVRLRTQVDMALRSARACITGGDFQQAGAASLAGMMNSFSKMRQYPVIREIDAILSCIGQEVEMRAEEGALAYWSAKHLSLVANGFSKGQGAWVQTGLTHLAQTLLAIPARQLTPGLGWQAPELVMMINGLGKGHGASIQQALAHLAKALPAARYLTPGSGWTPQHIALVTHGLGKAEGQAVQEALQQLAQVISREDLACLRQWEAQDLAMVAHGLGKGEGAIIQQALAHLARALPEGRQLTDESGWTGRRLAMMADGLAKGEGSCFQAARERLSRAVLMRGQLGKPSGWSGLSLAMMADGLSRGSGACIGQALVWLAEALLERMPLTAQSDQGQDPQSLALMVHALGKAEAAGVRALLQGLARVVTRVLGRGPAAGWTLRELAITAHGLASGEGPCIRKALTCLARAFLEKRQGLAGAAWPVRHQAMMAHGLSKGEGTDISEALRSLAQDLIPWWPLTAESGWTARPLAMMTQALACGEGPDIQTALVCLAQALPDEPLLTAEQGWTVPCLAMMTCGLGKGEGPELQEALDRLARVISACDLTGCAQWSLRCLAMAARGLARTSGVAARQALARLAGLACRLDLAQGAEESGRDLALLMVALGEALTDHAVFEKITSALVPHTGQEAGAVQDLLSGLSRSALSVTHLTAACRLLEAFRTQAVRPGSQQALNEMLWNITLFHFACVQHKPVDQQLAVSFAQFWHHFLFCTVTGCDADRNHADRNHADRNHADKSQAAFDAPWPVIWAADYWQPSAAARRGVPVTRGDVPVTWWDAPSTGPGSQALVYARLRQELPGHDICQQARINHCPVDILIDGRVCLLVEGPDHCVEQWTQTREQATGTLVRQRRTRDLFIDHMLRQYGYLVFRIDPDLARDPAGPDALVRQVRAALALPDGDCAAVQEQAQVFKACDA